MSSNWPFHFTDSLFETSFTTEVKESVSTSFVLLESFPRSSSGFINCLLLNVRSVRNKINGFSALLLMDSFDIVATTETWLNNDFSDSELQVFLDGFRTYLHKFNDTGISDLIITGDFNFSHIDWSTISPTNLNSQVESFCDILDDFFSYQNEWVCYLSLFNHWL